MPTRPKRSSRSKPKMHPARARALHDRRELQRAATLHRDIETLARRLARGMERADGVRAELAHSLARKLGGRLVMPGAVNTREMRLEGAIVELRMALADLAPERPEHWPDRALRAWLDSVELAELRTLEHDTYRRISESPAPEPLQLPELAGAAAV